MWSWTQSAITQASARARKVGGGSGESAWPSKLNTALPQKVWVALSLERIKLKMSLRVDLRLTRSCLPTRPWAEIVQKIDAQTPIVCSSGKRERTDTACTRP